jgi:hypothetical protein
MLQYIAQIAQGMLSILDAAEKLRRPNDDDGTITKQLRSVVPQCATLVAELQRIDPRDFLPEARHEFLIARLDLDLWRKQWGEGDTGSFVNQFFQDQKSRPEIRDLLARVITVLHKYGGEGWRAETRKFAFVKDNGLREIIQRDYKELALVLFPGGAWKSTVIMAGSILEAILFDKLGNDPVNTPNAMASSKAPKHKGHVIPLEDWKLEKLIDVAAHIGVLPSDREKTFDQVLRDYRNFVHPKKEVKAKHPCGEGEAELAKGALDALHDLWA